MANEPIRQTIELLRARSNILVIVGNGNSLDSAVSGLALREFLIKNNKQATVLSDKPIPAKLKFLPESGEVKDGSTLSKNLVIDISTLNTQISELRYQKFEDKLSVFLTPTQGEFSESDVKVRSAVYPFDLVVTIGVGNLEGLGSFYARHAQMFFEVPVVNIDIQAGNENYGRVNLIDLTAAANAEVVLDLLNEYDSNFLDGKTATLLLTGFIAATNSFQSAKTSPQIFLKASRLIGLGANQQEIVTQLYRSKSLGFLRLWGRVLARLKTESQLQLVYSLASTMDVEKSEAQGPDLDEIVFEMVQQLSFAKTFIFLAEASTDAITVYVKSFMPFDLGQVFVDFSPTAIGEQAFKFTVHNKGLADAEAEVIRKITTELGKIQG